MGWRTLLAAADERVTLPWLGGRVLRSFMQTWTLDGPLPHEHGWYNFRLRGRKAQYTGATEPALEGLAHLVTGYLVGDLMVADDGGATPDWLMGRQPRVYLLPDALDRFARVKAGRVHEVEPLVFHSLEMPLGPEEEVLQAYLDRQPTLDGIKGVIPSLNDAFRWEVRHREEAERRRAELEQRRRAEAERLVLEERRKILVKQLGDGAGRRAMATVDFDEAARAALAVGGAELLDTRKGQRGERVVRYRMEHQRFECVCDEKTMQIVDSGICLTDHDTDEKGDTYFTLESLPAVVRQATREGKLVVYRHV